MVHFAPIARSLGIGLGTITLIGSILLVATHQNPSCDMRVAGGSWQSCVNYFCTGPAVNIDAAITGAEYDVSCPWRERTYVFSYLAIALALIFIAVYGFAPRLKQLKLGTVLMIGGLITSALMIASFVMMIVDIVDGDNSRPSYKIDNYSISQVPFVFNSVLHSVALVAVLSLTLITYRESSKAPLLMEAQENAHDYYLRT